MELMSYLVIALICLLSSSTIVSAGKTCPYGNRIGNKCYHYVENSVDWPTAGENCKKLGGKLATIDNDAENNFVKGMIKSNAWIGLNDRTTEQTMQWADTKAKPTYFKWAFGEPNNFNWFGKTEDCVFMNSLLASGYWSDALCSLKQNYVCQFSRKKGVPQCIRGSKSKKKCYQFVDSVMTWQAAREHCKSLTRKATLATIENEEENSFVFGMITGKDSWIGLNDRATEKQFRWADKDQIPKFLKFAIGEPNNFLFNEDCVYISGYGLTARHWNDYNCETKKPFVCQLN